MPSGGSPQPSTQAKKWTTLTCWPTCWSPSGKRRLRRQQATYTGCPRRRRPTIRKRSAGRSTTGVQVAERPRSLAMNLTYDRKYLISLLEAQLDKLTQAWKTGAATRKAEMLAAVDGEIAELRRIRKVGKTGHGNAHQYMSGANGRGAIAIDIPEPQGPTIFSVEYPINPLNPPTQTKFHL